MSKIFPHRRRKARLSPPAWPPQLVENDLERRERFAREREARQQLESEKHKRALARLAARGAQKAESDRVETMAREATFPWEAAEPFLKMLERGGIVFNRRYPFTTQAVFWGSRLVLGPSMGPLYTALTGIELTPEQELLGSVSCPYTLDFERVRPIIEFLLISQPGLGSEETALRAELASCAQLMIEHRRTHHNRIQRGEDHYGQTIGELAPGWFSFIGGRSSNLSLGPLPTSAVFYDGKRLAVIPASTSADAS